MAMPASGRVCARVHEVALHALLDAAERVIEKKRIACVAAQLG
jgi:hypothetical protein